MTFSGPSAIAVSVLTASWWLTGGEVVFSTDNLNNGWDDNYKTQPADIGTYQYMLIYQPAVAGVEKIMHKGNVTLVR